VRDAEHLLAKIRAEDRSAHAELEAIFLLRHSGETDVELEPEIGNGRKCDFRIRRLDGAWVYVEVTAPDYANANELVKKKLGELTNLVEQLAVSVALEIFLQREPNPDELGQIREAALALCAAHPDGSTVRRELPQGLGALYLNEFQIGSFSPSDHGGEPRPMLGMTRAVRGDGAPNRQVVARIAYADDRAEDFIRSEAKQLPTNAPGLIMVDIQKASGGSVSWLPIVERRLQPTINTRVGGVCLFSGGVIPTDAGHAMATKVQLVPNRYAKLPLPAWINVALDSAGESWNRTAGVQ